MSPALLKDICLPIRQTVQPAGRKLRLRARTHALIAVWSQRTDRVLVWPAVTSPSLLAPPSPQFTPHSPSSPTQLATKVCFSLVAAPLHHHTSPPRFASPSSPPRFTILSSPLPPSCKGSPQPLSAALSSQSLLSSFSSPLRFATPYQQ